MSTIDLIIGEDEPEPGLYSVHVQTSRTTLRFIALNLDFIVARMIHFVAGHGGGFA